MSKNVAAKSWELSVYNGRRYSAGPPIVVDGWPLHEPAYLSVLPGVAGPGMDTPAGTGRHLETPATSVYFINSLENANTGAALTGLGPNVFGGTLEWCRRATASPKVIIPLVSGWAVLQKSLPLQTGTPPRPGYVTEAYHFAPHPGLWLRGAKVSLNGASDVAVWHLRSYMGDDETGVSVANRDPMGSGYTGGVVTNVAAINCELAWSCDELLDMYYAHDGVSLVNCAFTNPLHETSLNPSEDHGFGPMMGGGSQFGVAASFRCLWSNITDRAPFTNAEAYTHANNLHFNSGRPGGGAGYAVRIVNQAATEAVLVNALANGFVRGPENNSSIVAVSTAATLPAGSQGYLEDNAVHGWTAATQAALLSTSISGFAQSALIEDAYPPEWGEDGVLRWSAQAPMPTEQEWDGYVSLMEATVGAQPGWRMSQFGKVSSVFQAVKDTLAGNMPGFQFSDSVADEGGWFDVPEVGPIDPTDPGAHWWAAFPTSGRDDVLNGSATWGNESWIPEPFRGTGLQLAGRTVLERWIIKQHWYVMDPSTRPALPPSGDWADVFVDADGVQAALATDRAIVGVRGDTLSDFNPRLSSGNGATLDYIAAASFDGQEPAIEMRPPTALVGDDADYASILDTRLDRSGAANIAQLNFRWLAYYGPQYHSLAPNAKVTGMMLGSNPADPDTYTARIGIFDNKLSGYLVWAVTSGTTQTYYNPPDGYHPGDGTAANLMAQLSQTINHGNSPPRVGQEWLCFEMVVDARRNRGNADGMNRLVMTARDGTQRELVIPLDWDAGWNFSNQYIGIFEGLGFYFNTAGTANADNYVRWSHCAFSANLDSDELIGPPPGFLV